MSKKSTHLVKKDSKIVKNTAVGATSPQLAAVPLDSEPIPVVAKDIYEIHCGKCGEGIGPKNTCSLGQGLYLCKKCYSEG